MKRILLFSIIVLLILPIIDAAVVEQGLEEQLEQEQEIKVIVKLKQGISEVQEELPVDKESRKKVRTRRLNIKKQEVISKQDKVLNKLNKKDFKLKHKYKTISGFSGTITKQALEELKNNPDVEFIYRDRVIHKTLNNSAPQINADDVWKLQVSNTNLTGSGETICVVDSGIDTDHSAFTGRIVAQYCYCDIPDLGGGGCCPDTTGEDNDAEDDEGHGTHCAGIAASSNETYKGTAPGAKIAAVKVLNSSGSGSWSILASGIDWCVDNANTYNISVISLSVGSGDENNNPVGECNGFLTAVAIDNAVGAGILVVAASGNEGFTNGINYPACVTNATSIGSVDKSNAITAYSNIDEILDLVAPGGTANNCVNGICSSCVGGTFCGKYGTSMATPHAAGAAALLFQYSNMYNLGLTPTQITNALKNMRTNVSKSGLTFPIIDVLAALQSIDADQPTVNFTEPIPTDNLNSTNTSFEINATVEDILNNISSCKLEINSVNHTMTLSRTGKNISCYTNKSFNGSGTQTYRVYAQDLQNNIGVSPTRTLTIINSKPNITFAEIVSSDIKNRTNGTLTANYTITEINNDALIQNQTKWYKNNTEITGLRNSTQLDSANISKYQIWHYSIRTYDGSNWSNWKNSTNITINNAIPDLSPVKNQTSVLETELVNITVSATDADNDNLTYDINDTRFTKASNSFTWQTTETDNSTFTVRVNVTDGSATVNITFPINISILDYDADGTPDYNDTDDDNDGINDSIDTLTGNNTYISSLQTLNLFVNNSDNVTIPFNETYLVNITDQNNNTLVTFTWNFTKATLKVNWTINYTSTNGTIRIQDIDLTNQDTKKTIYINKSISTHNYVCIVDDETTPISSLPDDCTGYTKVPCTGSSGQYTCTALTNQFMIQGLDHSAVKGIYVAPPANNPASGGGGGGGGSSRCTEVWNCTDWGICSIFGEQIRTCIDTNQCGTEEVKPIDLQTCITKQPKTKQEPVETQETTDENKTDEKSPTGRTIADKLGFNNYRRDIATAAIILLATSIGYLIILKKKKVLNLNKQTNNKKR